MRQLRHADYQEKLAAKRHVRIEDHLSRLVYSGEALVRTHDMDDVVDALEAIGVSHHVERYGRGLWAIAIVEQEVSNG